MMVGGMCSSILFLSWCTDAVVDTSTVQTIQFVDYETQISNDYQSQSPTDLVDQRVSDKIVWLYTVPTYTWYAHTIVISHDKVSPSLSLEDYVQASIGGIADTRKNYTSLWFEHGVLWCTNSELPTIKVSFSIIRLIPWSVSEQLYFIHYYVKRLDEVVLLSLSSTDEAQSLVADEIIAKMSCISSQDL